MLSLQRFDNVEQFITTIKKRFQLSISQMRIGLHENEAYFSSGFVASFPSRRLCHFSHLKNLKQNK